MMKRLTMILATIAPILVVGASGLYGGAATQQERMRATSSSLAEDWIADLPRFENFETISAATGAFSPTTGEFITGVSTYVSAHIEGADGNRHPGFSDNRQEVHIFRTTGGRLVIRFLDWPCAC